MTKRQSKKLIVQKNSVNADGKYKHVKLVSHVHIDNKSAYYTDNQRDWLWLETTEAWKIEVQQSC